jgi:hypothetical protein
MPISEYLRRLRGRVGHGGPELRVRYANGDELAALPLSRWARAVLPPLIARRGSTWIPPVRCRPPRA